MYFVSMSRLSHVHIRILGRRCERFSRMHFQKEKIRKKRREILTFFFYSLRLCTLDAFVFGATVTSTINGDARKWIAYQLNHLVLASSFTAKFICEHLVKNYFNYGKMKPQATGPKIASSFMQYSYSMQKHVFELCVHGFH